MITAVFERPSERMSFLVNRYLFLKSGSDVEPYTDKFIPDGYAGLVFNYFGDVKIVEKGESVSLPPFFVTIPTIRSVVIHVEPPSESMIAICRAPALARIFKLKLNRIQQSPGPYQLSEELHNLFLPVVNATSDPSRIQAFESAVLSWKSSDGYVYDKIDMIYEFLLKNDVTEKVSKLAIDFGLNDRSLRRVFSQRVGVSPKELMSIVRVHRLWSYIMKNPGLDNFDFVYLGGFYDQAHFIHDFKKIVGETPGAFFKRNSEYARALSGKES